MTIRSAFLTVECSPLTDKVESNQGRDLSDQDSRQKDRIKRHRCSERKPERKELWGVTTEAQKRVQA